MSQSRLLWFAIAGHDGANRYHSCLSLPRFSMPDFVCNIVELLIFAAAIATQASALPLHIPVQDKPVCCHSRSTCSLRSPAARPSVNRAIHECQKLREAFPP